MAAQVEVQTTEVGRTVAGGRHHLTPLTDSSNKSLIDIPSVNQPHVIAAEPNKPAPSAKPRLTPKPFSVEKNPTIKPILAPKPQTKPRPESTRLVGYKPEFPSNPKPQQPVSSSKPRPLLTNPNRPASTSFRSPTKLNTGQTTKPVAQPFKPAPPHDTGDPNRPTPPPVPAQRQKPSASSLAYSKSFKKLPAAEWSGTTKKEDEKGHDAQGKVGTSLTRAKSMGFLLDAGQENEGKEKAQPETPVPLRPHPRGSKPRPVSAIFPGSPTKTENPVPTPRWAGRRPLSADLTSKFESIGLSLHRKVPEANTVDNTPEGKALPQSKEEDKTFTSTTPQCTDDVCNPILSDQSNKNKEEMAAKETDEDKRRVSVKSRISLLLDLPSSPGVAATGHGSDLHSPLQPTPEGEPAVGVKQLIKQLTEDTTPTQSPVLKPALKPRPLPLDLTKRFSADRSPDPVSLTEAEDRHYISKDPQKRAEESAITPSDQKTFLDLKDSQEQLKKVSTPEGPEAGQTFGAVSKEIGAGSGVQTVRASLFDNVVERHSVVLMDDGSSVDTAKDLLSSTSPFDRTVTENNGAPVTANYSQPLSPSCLQPVLHAFDTVQAVEESRAVSESVPSAQWEDKAMTLRSRRSEGSRPLPEWTSPAQEQPPLMPQTQPRYLRIGALQKWTTSGLDQDVDMETGMLKESQREGQVTLDKDKERQRVAEQEEVAAAPKRLKMLQADEMAKPKATYFALTGQIQEPVSLGGAGTNTGDMTSPFDDFLGISLLSGPQGKSLPVRGSLSLNDDPFGKTTPSQEQVEDLMIRSHKSPRESSLALDGQSKEERLEAEKKREQRKEKERHRTKIKEIEREKQTQLEMEKLAHLEFTRMKEREMQREFERQRTKSFEKEKQEFEEKQRALERQKQIELEKVQELEEKQRLEREKQRKLEKEKRRELERQREREQHQKQKEEERLKQLERLQLLELQRQKQKEKEIQQLKEKKEKEEADKMRQIALEQEMLRVKELEKEREREKEMEKERQKEIQRELEKRRQQDLERGRQRQLDIEQQELEKERKRKEDVERLKELERLQLLEFERQKQAEREKQQIQELEKQRQLDIERQKLENQRLRQQELEKERKRKEDVERLKELERLQLLEFEKQKQVERERQQFQELEKQRQLDIERQELENQRLRQQELEKERKRKEDVERLKELERLQLLEFEKQKQVERERQQFQELEKQRQLDIERQELENQRLRQQELEKERKRKEDVERLKELERLQLLEYDKQKQAERERQQIAEFEKHRLREKMEREEAERMRVIAKQQEAERQRLKEKQKKEEQERLKLEPSPLKPKVLDLDSVLRNEPMSKSTSQRSDAATRWKEPYKPTILDIDSFTSQAQHSSNNDLFPSLGMQGLNADFGGKLQPTPESDFSWKIPPQTSVGFSNPVWTTPPQDPWELQSVEMSVDQPKTESRKHANKHSPEQLLLDHGERIPTRQRPWSAFLDESPPLGPFPGSEVKRVNSPGGLPTITPAEQIWLPRELQPQKIRGEAQGQRRSQGSKELNRLRSRSVSRRSAPAGSAVDGSLSRMRSRSAHREQDLQSRVQQKQSVSGEEEGKGSETPVRETDSQYGTWETGLRTDDSLTPATPSSESNLSPSPKKPTPAHTPGDVASPFESNTLDGLPPSSPPESQPLSFPDAPTTLLDTSVLRSRAQLGKKRAPRTRPTRATRQSAAQAEGEGGTTEDWLYRDSTEAKAQSKDDDSDSEEKPRGADAAPAVASQPQRVALFPGMDPSALKAQLKKRGDSDNQTDGPAPSPSQLSRSPKSPFLPRAARVLPPSGGKENGQEDSPQWLKELKSKKRLSQYESES
ncbi:calponin homology domain-containing protein DDB_G0272472 isoform X1 [Oreochromis niloticus]|uniref:calponin homology domain-containing protein DDB_G0272472 isoform X1 n=1 Tax=Oreochromis niloticus TaxID=8128 RepID=UPI000904E164|nr:calponin homology domain-containing protein DDB_G0272472 isoform X1 [Oreochromis niloticus]